MSLYATGVIRILTEPQLKSFDSGTMVCSFIGGIPEGKDKNGNYLNNAIEVEAWGKSAEVITDRCSKGDCILISGNIRQQTWNDKNTGDKRNKHTLSVARFEFLPRTASANTSSTATTEEEPF